MSDQQKRPTTSEDRAAGRATELYGRYHFDVGLDYTDGYRVTVGWSDEDDAWIARVSGLSVGDQLADGPTKEKALLALACSLSATIDAINTTDA